MFFPEHNVAEFRPRHGVTGPDFSTPRDSAGNPLDGRGCARRAPEAAFVSWPLPEPPVG